MSKAILHLLTPGTNVSPFDVNMAADAGYDVIVPYTGVTAETVAGMVQDAMFSRAPADAARTGVFIGGRDAGVSLDILKAAAAALFDPFRIRLMADPSGAFTTAAALVARVDRLLADRFGTTLSGRRVAIFGGTGVVAFGAAVLACRAGAAVRLVGYDGPVRVGVIADAMANRFGLHPQPVDGSDPDKVAAIARAADVILSAGRAGVRILTPEAIAGAGDLLVAADVNAVPPSGIAGIEAGDDGKPVPGHGRALGLGALAIGQIKWQTQHRLMAAMAAGTAPPVIGLDEAHAEALAVLGAR